MRLGAALTACAEAPVVYAPTATVPPPEPAERVAAAATEVAPATERRPDPDSDDENAGQRPAALSETDGAANGSSGLPESESTNVWPDETAEAAFIAEARGRGEPVVVAPEVVVEVEERSKPLPKLDELVQRIPAETRELLDELFRVKFTAVRRVRKSDLKA